MQQYENKIEAQKLRLSEEDGDAFKKMIKDKIGCHGMVLHGIVSDGLPIDVIVVSPSEKRDYYTLITMGMSGFPMPVPSECGNKNRAEVAVRLPKDWNINSNDEKWCWPIRMIKTLAGMPYKENSWLGRYHDIDFGGPFSEETELCGVMLDFFDESIEPLTLENGDELILYNAIPVFRSEMDYRFENGGEALADKMSDEILHGPVDIHRTAVV